MFPKFIQVGLYSEGLIWEMLIGLHIWEAYIWGGGGGVLTSFYGIFSYTSLLFILLCSL